MKVFHFMEKQYAFSNLLNKRLKVATLHSMNDPYEFYLNFHGADNAHLKNFKAHFNNTVGFLCFSTNLAKSQRVQVNLSKMRLDT